MKNTNGWGGTRTWATLAAQALGGLSVIAALFWSGGQELRAAPMTVQAAGWPGVGGAGGSGEPISFADDFESGGWSFFSSTGHGNGYVSYRPADAVPPVSPTHVGDMYNPRDPEPGYSVLTKQFALPGSSRSCWAVIAVKPLSNIHAQLELRDAQTQALLAAHEFFMAGGEPWTQVIADSVDGAPMSVAFKARIVLLDNGTWQEMLVDDFYGGCSLFR